MLKAPEEIFGRVPKMFRIVGLRARNHESVQVVRELCQSTSVIQEHSWIKGNWLALYRIRNPIDCWSRHDVVDVGEALRPGGHATTRLQQSITV
jgi:hypothetical protein